MPPKRIVRDASPKRQRKPNNDPPEVRAAKRELKLERDIRKHKVQAYDGTLIVRTLTDCPSLALSVLETLFPDCWTRLYSEPFIMPKGTQRVAFLGCFPADYVYASVFNNPRVEASVLCLCDTELPVYLAPSHTVQGENWFATVSAYLDQVFPDWQQKTSFEWLHYYVAEACGFPGLEDAERFRIQRVLYGIEELQFTFADLSKNWSPALEQRLEKAASKKDLLDVHKTIHAELSKAQMAFFRPPERNGEPCELDLEARLVRNPAHPSKLREMYNAFKEQHPDLLLLLVEQPPAEHSSKVRNLEVFGPGELDLSGCPGFVRGEPGWALFLFFSEDEFQKVVCI